MSKIQLIIYIAIGLIVALALLLAAGVIPGFRPEETPPFAIEIWSPEDSYEVWRPMIEKYREGVRNAGISYIKKNAASYESELINALASGGGPDIFWLKDTELQRHLDKIKPLSSGLGGYQKKNIKSTFADALASSMVNSKDELLGVPLAFDNLALFYNRDYFNSANIPSPPRSWDDLSDQAKALSKFSDAGGIKRSGAALGTAANVAHASDVLMAFIHQSGGAVLDPAGGQVILQSPAAESALRFYASFADPTQKAYSWNSSFDDSLRAFARGDAAMAFGYAGDIGKIVSQNPQLNFDVAPLPQLNPQGTQVNFGRFGLLSVSRLSKEPENSWNFLLWLAGRDIEKKYIDAVGLPPARRDLVATKPPRDYLSVFYEQVLSSRVWPVIGDGFIPQAIDDMIDAVARQRFDAGLAVNKAAADIGKFLKR
ncbi:MAG: extracellular solute-binding protein [Candidatus Sungbacteria bacterium]|nr:extracellular solute-binding protein [Candidatus Sungbacteria bacterium]